MLGRLGFRVDGSARFCGGLGCLGLGMWVFGIDFWGFRYGCSASGDVVGKFACSLIGANYK